MFSVVNRGQLNGTTEHEFENLNSRLKGLWLTEHNEDGTHNIAAMDFSELRLQAGNISSGVFDTSLIPDLDASKIVSGTFAAARIPSLDASKITTGTFTATQIPNLDASKITTGSLADARLSANVPLLNAANIFTANQRINAGLGVNVAPGSTGDIKLSGSVYEQSRSVAMGIWQSYTPGFFNSGATQPTLGNGSLIGKYTVIGNTCWYAIRFVAGSTTTFGTAGGVLSFGLPIAQSGAWIGNIGAALMFNHNTATWGAHVATIFTTSQITVTINGGGGVIITNSPWVWGNTDQIHLAGFINIA